MAGCAALSACEKQSGEARPDPVRQEASCELDAKSFVTIHEKNDPYENQQMDIADRIELCMRSKGYNIKDKVCTLTKFDSLSMFQRNSNPDCYSPPL